MTRASDRAELDRINELIHDYWFDVEDVTFDEATSTVQMRFSRPHLGPAEKSSGWSLLRPVDVAYVESFLRIHHVRSWALEDTERVGSYDFNELRYDQAAHRIQIATGVPLGLYADVEALEVSVMVTDTVGKTEKRLAFLLSFLRMTLALKRASQ